MSKSVLYLLEECRMVLPGIQALFGFQLTVVFNPGFSQKLDHAKQQLHFVAIALLAVAIVLIMTPAAYHRQTSAEYATRSFLKLASWLLLASMFPLAVSICLEIYLIGFALEMGAWASITAGLIIVLLIFFWFILPRLSPDRNRSDDAS